MLNRAECQDIGAYLISVEYVSPYSAGDTPDSRLSRLYPLVANHLEFLKLPKLNGRDLKIGLTASIIFQINEMPFSVSSSGLLWSLYSDSSSYEPWATGGMGKEEDNWKTGRLYSVHTHKELRDSSLR